ncbi:MAG: hypothetical protein ACE5HG_01565 [Candidatus Bathyarchaeia archaeon]
MDLRNVHAAAIMGYVGDAKIDDYTLLIGQKECFKDFETCVYEAFGKIRIGNYDAGSIEHHHVSKLLSYVLSIAGYDVSKRQTAADNPAPLWFFIMDDSFKGAYLRRFWDAEGSSPSLTRRSLVLSQAVRVDIKNFISQTIKKITFRRLPDSARKVVLINPPLSLISAQILHMSLGIVSQVKPEVINVSKDGETSALWKLFIYGKDEMEKFHDKIGFGIKQKMNALNRYLDQVHRTFSHRWEAYWKTLELAAKLETFTERELARAYGITVLSIRRSLRELKVNGDVIYIKRKRETREKIWKITQVGLKKLSTF